MTYPLGLTQALGSWTFQLPFGARLSSGYTPHANKSYTNLLDRVPIIGHTTDMSNTTVPLSIADTLVGNCAATAISSAGNCAAIDVAVTGFYNDYISSALGIPTSFLHGASIITSGTPYSSTSALRDEIRAIMIEATAQRLDYHTDAFILGFADHEAKRRIKAGDALVLCAGGQRVRRAFCKDDVAPAVAMEDQFMHSGFIKVRLLSNGADVQYFTMSEQALVAAYLDGNDLTGGRRV